jgi:hypothetical protein
VESNPNKGTSIRGSILLRQTSQHASLSYTASFTGNMDQSSMRPAVKLV